MGHVMYVFFMICFIGFCVYHMMNLILWCFGGIEEDEDEE